MEYAILATGVSPIWYWFFLILFFVLGFLAGVILWRRMLGLAFSVEQENRRMHAAFQKRERSYKQNRETVSSTLGQDAVKRK